MLTSCGRSCSQCFVCIAHSIFRRSFLIEFDFRTELNTSFDHVLILLTEVFGFPQGRRHTGAQRLTACDQGRLPERLAPCFSNFRLVGRQDTIDTAILSANDGSAVQVARDDSGPMTPARPLITEDNVDTVLENSGGVPLYATEYAQEPASSFSDCWVFPLFLLPCWESIHHV